MKWLRYSDDITSWVHYHYQKIIPLLSFLDLSKEDDSDECEAALIGRRIPLTMSLHQKNSLAALISQIIYLTALNDDIIPLTAFIYLIIPLTAPIHRTSYSVAAEQHNTTYSITKQLMPETTDQASSPLSLPS